MGLGLVSLGVGCAVRASVPRKKAVFNGGFRGSMSLYDPLISGSVW